MRKLRFLAVMLLSLFLWQSTEIMAAPTAASATVGCKTVNRSNEFTESGGNVTFPTTSIANGGGISSSVAELVNPKPLEGNGKWFQNLGSTSTPSVNLALNKPVKSSSDENDGKKASYAVDGNTVTAWSSAWTDDASFQVDLITRKTFDKIVIQWETAYSKSFTIKAGNNVDANGDLVDGTVIATVTDQTIDNANHNPQTISVAQTTARYIRFESSLRGTGYGNSFYEFEVYADQCTTALDPTDVPAVKSVGTDGITAVRALYDQGTAGYGFAFDSWSSENKTENTQETVAGKTIDLFNNFTFYGSSYTAFDATLWEKLHVDIYPMDGVSTVAIMPIKEGTGGKGQQFTVTPGQWNSLELDMATLAAAGLDITDINQIMIGGSLNGDGGMENANGNGAIYVGNIYYYTTAILPPTTIPSIKTVGTDGITAVKALYDQGSKENGFDFTAWGGHTDPTAATVDGKTISLFSNFSYLGGQYTAFDATQWDKLVIDVYPMTDMTVNVFPINAGNTEYSQQFTPTKGEWTSLEVDLQQLYNSGAGLDISGLNQLKVNGGTGTQQFYVGNIYYYSTQNITYAAPTDVPGIITSFNDGNNTYSIASDQVTKIFSVDGNRQGRGFLDHWGDNSSATLTQVHSGKNVVKYENFKVAGGGFDRVDFAGLDYVHIDVYPMQPMTMAFAWAESGDLHGKPQKSVQKTLTPGTWNQIDIPLSVYGDVEYTTSALFTQNTNDAGAENPAGTVDNLTVYLGNYYYFKTASVPDTEAPVMTTATVSNIGTTTATLTVNATDNKAGNLTYNIYNGSTEGTPLATATGAAGQNTVVNLTGLTQGGTYNLVVTATDAASNTSASMAVAEFTTLDYIPTLTTIYVRMKGESTDAYNVSATGTMERTIQIIALDQKGNDMATRQMGLRIVDGNTGTNDVSIVATVNVNTVPQSSETGSTAIRVNNHVGRVTIEAVDNLTGKTGYGFLTFYDAANTADTNEDQLISNPAQVASAKITGANESIIRLAADGHGTSNYVSDGAHPAEFVVDWSSIQDNQQHYEYYDIDMIQVLYQQGKFPSDYTIAVSHDGGETYEDVYHYDGTQEFYNPSTNPGFRADGWNASRQNTQAVSHIRFRSNNNDAIAFDAFKVYGKLNTVVDNNPPYDLYAGLVAGTLDTDQTAKTSTAKIWLECKDDKATTINYTLTSASGMQYTISGPAGGGVANQVQYDFQNTLVPGTHYVFTVVASDGRNKSNPVTVTFNTPPLNQAPKVSISADDVASTTATLHYWLPEGDNTLIGADDNIVFAVKRGTAVVADAEYKKGQADENNKVALNLTGLAPNTTYTYTVTATNSVTGLSSEASVQFTTNKGGSSLEVWFTDGGTHYTGWTGELEDIISNSSKGDRDVLGVTEIHIKGSLNNEDIKLLRRMAGGASYIGNNAVKKRVFIKADAAPYLYAWIGDASTEAQKPLGAYPGRKLTTITDGYYVCEFENTDEVKVVINDGTVDGYGDANHKTKDITLAAGNNYFTYDGGNVCDNKTETGYYGKLATMDLAQAEFYHDGGSYVTRWYANANTPTILNPIDGEFKSSPNIEGYMFMECKNLRTVTVPTDCKEIALNAFYGGTDKDGISLTTINLNNVLEVIAGYAFEKNEKLGQVTLPSTLKQIGYNAFCDCHDMTLGNANGQLPNSITDIDNQAFANTSIAEVILPANASYTTVKTNVFGWSRELAKVTIPANVTTLMDGSFRDSKKLAVIDDAAATITEIGDEAFMNDIALPSAEVNGLIAHLTTLNNSVFNGCTAVNEVNIPASVTTLKNLTFANCTNINRVTVNSATAPSGYTLTEGEMKNTNGETTDPFAAVVANHMTLTFAGAADGGYKSYREGTAKSNAFHRLLTKTLDEVATSYDVAGQMHADVVLKRTMVEGWNTVALPFGVNKDNTFSENDRDRSYKYAGVYKEAFNGDVAENNNFMIAAYRGIEDDVFKFLKYANYEQDPLDEFEPLLIRMGSGNISHNNEYTFEDVDLNYDVEENKLYRDGNANEEVPVQRWDAASSSFKPFIGSNYNNEMSWFSKTTADFAFTGTYFTKTTKDNDYTYNSTDDYFIQPGDYIIQSNLFYETIGTKQYRLKGYRAWFQKQSNTTGARPAQLMFRVMELDSDTPTEIDSFDAIDNDVKPFDVYSIGGQLLRKQTKSLNGLPNGIYIVNGRKVAVGK